MEERRKSVRMELKITATIVNMNKDNPQALTVVVKDLSTNGIGFESEELLGIGQVYEADITIWTQEVLHVFLKIVRIELLEDGYAFGASFVGMPQNDSQRIDVYQAVRDEK